MIVQFFKPIKSYIWWILLISILLFLINKHVVRPRIDPDDFPLVVITFVHSLPNFIEPIYGTLVLLIFIYAYRRNRPLTQPINIGRKTVLILIPFVSLYTIFQEINWINISTNSTYDPNDVKASILGTIFINSILLSFGFLKEVNAEQKP